MSIGNIREKSEIDSRNDDVALEQGRMEKEKEKKIIEKSNERLKQLVPNDELYEAMENFLLGDPVAQVPQLGEPEEIIARSKQKATKGADLIARAEFETAAKVAIYEQKEDLARDSLELAALVTKPDDKHARMQNTLLGDLDEVMQIASDYYVTREKVTSEATASPATSDKK